VPELVSLTEVPVLAPLKVCAADTSTSADEVTETGDAKVFDVSSFTRRSDVMVIVEAPELKSA
jgi:hypothetical protein